MAIQASLKIDGIDGEIPLVSFSWGATRPSGGGGGAGGKAAVQDFRFAANTGPASPLLMVASFTGKSFRQATLAVRKGGGRLDYVKVVLTDVNVSSFYTGSTPIDAGGYSPLKGTLDTPLDMFSLDFAKIEYQFTPQRADGAAGTPVKGSYDRKTNKAG